MKIITQFIFRQRRQRLSVECAVCCQGGGLVIAQPAEDFDDLTFAPILDRELIKSVGDLHQLVGSSIHDNLSCLGAVLGCDRVGCIVWWRWSL